MFRKGSELLLSVIISTFFFLDYGIAFKHILVLIALISCTQYAYVGKADNFILVRQQGRNFCPLPAIDFKISNSFSADDIRERRARSEESLAPVPRKVLSKNASR
ncbi:hypothetical protein CDAR_260841 [Caerostris darwini]|uniref:Uncharacterized protein n=1 Tax=Caerostris darwini TaxID=1538125 RepID=A0AAV4MEH9_9ARAC|nr:hypothetical protein CDAR_260841 [Caerostris darwini]